MVQKTINVGTVANDGTGDTIRGAFTNVNANFTEIFNNVTVLTAAVASIDTGQNVAISSAYTTSNAAFNTTNAAFDTANNVGINANLYSVSIGAAGNAYAVSIGAAGNSVSTIIGNSANAYSVSIGAAGNSYTVEVGTASNTYAIVIGTAGNNYASILAANLAAIAANNAAGGNTWANTTATAGNNWTISTFSTLSNTSIVFNTTNASFDRANTALQNTTGTFVGNLSITGSITSLGGGFTDAIGPVREKFANTTNSNVTVQIGRSVIIANNLGQIYINVERDDNFLLPANIGSTIEIFQYGPGPTTIRPNTPEVTIYSSNNWANIAGQYLSVSLVKILSNTWILTGDLKP
jgi:hypothetical protein